MPPGAEEQTLFAYLIPVGGHVPRFSSPGEHLDRLAWRRPGVDTTFCATPPMTLVSKRGMAVFPIYVEDIVRRTVTYREEAKMVAKAYKHRFRPAVWLEGEWARGPEGAREV